MFKLKKDLLEINALELDDTLLSLLDTRAGGNDSEVEFVNEEGLVRKFKLNKEERIISGRGIKGFFNSYQAEFLFVESSPTGGWKISAPRKMPGRWAEKIIDNPAAKERLETVLKAMNGLNPGDQKWFELYHQAREFVVDSQENRLLCLPYLRDLEPYEYQLRAVKSAIDRFKGRVMFSDEVGLGKTIEAGIGMLEYIMRGLVKKVLVLVPPSLVNQWYYEIKRKLNQDFIRADEPEFKKLGDQAWVQNNKVIASLALAKRKSNSDIISQINYDLVIVDEAHHLKSRNSVAWKFVNNIKKKYIFLLTATPVQNNLEELYNLITLLKPGQLKTYSNFKKNFMEGREGIEAKNVPRLRELLADVMIRNKRSDVGIKFTGRQAVTTAVHLLPREQEVYDNISDFIREKYQQQHPVLTRFVLKNLQEQMGSTFSAMVNSLATKADNDQLAAADRQVFRDFHRQTLQIVESEAETSPKMVKLVEIVKDFQDKMLIFTKYKSTQKFIVKTLKQNGFAVAEFHGGLRRKDKEEQIAYFEKKAIVLVSTEVGGEGRNLQFCNGMINYDLPWNPMAIEQRIGRLHRIGQARDVFVFNLVAKNTLEYHILNLLDRKINMFELVVGEVDLILGDIEEKENFGDLIMNAWVHSPAAADMEKEMDSLGEKLLENKNKLLKIKQLDELLFEEKEKV
ncbi:MAG: RNA polymerase-associated protein RapA [Dehalococcoidia bacterium]|nr:RNA polymerase-associated protein RapA [Bacillota bacterium]